MKASVLCMFLLLSPICFSLAQQVPPIPYAQGNGNQTATYAQIKDWWSTLAQRFEQVAIHEFGVTDSGEPLQWVYINAIESPNTLPQVRKYPIVMINNGIHPGEPDGIDASMMLVQDLLEGTAGHDFLKKGALVVIPVYNIGGAINRNRHSRTNQNGPEAYGFRGNARNYDLNRDFIKADTKNALAFSRGFHAFDPEVMIDTHVSNGADYQYVLTLLSTQKDKLGGQLGQYLHQTLEPALFKEMEELGEPITPYVNAWGGTPDQGWPQFYDSPRYSSGYAALFQCLSFMTETHMLKPYTWRVQATHTFLHTMLVQVANDGKKILKLKQADRQYYAKGPDSLALHWQVDKGRFTPFNFKGYEAVKPNSAVSGLPLLQYDREQPFEKEVPFYNHYTPAIKVKVPKAYIIPQGWHEVLQRLRLNGVQMRQIEEDTVVDLVMYKIADFKTRQSPYEGHYLHYNVQVQATPRPMGFRTGDWYVPTNQAALRYIMETLEPQGPDAFFAWNFFDTILQQKEGFSSYVFEKEAAEMLAKDPDLKQALEAAKAANPDLAQSTYAQLSFIYQRSKHKETAHMRHPVYRVE